MSGQGAELLPCIFPWPSPGTAAAAAELGHVRQIPNTARKIILKIWGRGEGPVRAAGMPWGRQKDAVGMPWGSCWDAMGLAQGWHRDAVVAPFPTSPAGEAPMATCQPMASRQGPHSPTARAPAPGCSQPRLQNLECLFLGLLLLGAFSSPGPSLTDCFTCCFWGCCPCVAEDSVPCPGCWGGLAGQGQAGVPAVSPGCHSGLQCPRCGHVSCRWTRSKAGLSLGAGV